MQHSQRSLHACNIVGRKRRALFLSTASSFTQRGVSASSAIILPKPAFSTGCKQYGMRPCALFNHRRNTCEMCNPCLLTLPVAVLLPIMAINALTLRIRLCAMARFFSQLDTETILQLVARSDRGNTSRFTDALFQIEGAYALVVLTNKKLIGARDPLGIRPLFSVSLTAIIFWLRKPALDIIGAQSGAVENGEIVVITRFGLKVSNPSPNLRQCPCVFDIFIFRDPTAYRWKKVFMTAERHWGANCPESAVSADVVIPVPDSGGYHGYADQPINPLSWASSAITMSGVPLLSLNPSALFQEIKHIANRVNVDGKRDLIDDRLCVNDVR